MSKMPSCNLFLSSCCCRCWKPSNAVGNDNNTNGCNDSGNPRNKCALKPGHSLMDWIRLGNSGIDLSGVGIKAGHMTVSPSELELHNKLNDAWICIRGHVYNITPYLPFHPGGPDELMKGAGIDGTTLFEQIHPWVNYNQILQKCHIGKMGSGTAAFNANNRSKSLEKKDSERDLAPLLKKSLSTLSLELTTTPPRFDWIQKLDTVTLIFYTPPMSNPLLELWILNTTSSTQILNTIFTFTEYSVSNEVTLSASISGFDTNTSNGLKINHETGKIEITLRKTTKAVWPMYGSLKQSNCTHLNNERLLCTLNKKIQMNYNTYLLELRTTDQLKLVPPIGKHVDVHLMVENTEMCRNYTPIPISLLYDGFKANYSNGTNNESVCLLVKRYPDGNVSKALCDLAVGDSVAISKPLGGTFELKHLENYDKFAMFAAGTGITPMLNLLLFLLDKRLRKCRILKLVFFNRSLRDILLRQALDDLAVADNRFSVTYVLSDPDDYWDGIKGRISKDLLNTVLEECTMNTQNKIENIYNFICGPIEFTNITCRHMQDIGIENQKIHCFFG